MEQEPILNNHNLAESESRANPICFAEPKQGHELNDHNLAESESRANPICFAEPKQGHELNDHNKQEYPPMHTGGLNTTLFIKRMVLCLVLVMMAYSVSAQQRMYPIPKDNLKKNNFDKKLSLGFGIDTAYKFVYQVEPSFTTEYCLTYDSINKSLLLCKSKSKIGYALGNGESKKERKKRLKYYRLPVDEAYVDSLQSLFCAITKSASPDSKRLGLDGTSYLFYLPTDIFTVADAWSPYEDSNCGRAVRLMERLCKAVEKRDNAAAEQLREEIVALTAVFRSLPTVFYVH